MKKKEKTDVVSTLVETNNFIILIYILLIIFPMIGLGFHQAAGSRQQGWSIAD